jgi:hypothetical protein
MLWNYGLNSSKFDYQFNEDDRQIVNIQISLGILEEHNFPLSSENIEISIQITHDRGGTGIATGYGLDDPEVRVWVPMQ